MAGAAAGGQPQVPNINQAAAQGIYGAGLGSAAGMGYQPNQVSTGQVGNVTAGQIAGMEMSQYMNPYTQQVIEANEADILRGAQSGMNSLDTQAGRAGAFGGSRHGIAMGEMGTGVARELARSSAGLRQAGFQNAQQMATGDLGRTFQADLANQGMQQGNLQRQFQADQFNVTSGLQGAQQRLGAANQLGAISEQGYGMGRLAQQDLANTGAQQQLLQQALIDAGRGQYDSFMGAPASSLGYVTTALGATPGQQTTTNTRDPGVFDYLTLGASMVPGSGR